MKISEKVNYDQNRTFLYEGLNPQTINETRDWERILKPIVEAQLTPDQINQLFTQAQQIATAGGANRTLAGKGVDTANAAGEAFEKVKTAMQNTGPIQGFEAQYDKIAAKLKEKTGGDQGVMKYIQMYRDFATKHPVAQKVIYSAAIAALGALAVGGSIAAVSGGPVVLGVFKMVDRLLQGDKLTTAAWQGIKTGAGAAAAVGLGKMVRGALGLGAPTSTPLNSKIVNRPDDFGPTGAAQPQGGVTTPTIAQGGNILNPPAEIQGNKQLSAAYKELVNKIQSNPDYNVRNLSGDIQRFASQNSVGGLQATKDASALSQVVQKAAGGDMKAFVNAVKAGTGAIGGATAGTGNFEESLYVRLRENLDSRQTLPKSQIQEMFRLADEGAWDAFKKGASAVGGAVASGAKAVAGSRIGQAVGATAKDAAGAVAQKVGTVATNITTKVTSDKLMKAWKTAGSPTDSVEVYNIMKQQGLDDTMLANIFKAAKVRLPAASSGKQLSQTPGAIRKRAARAAAKSAPAPQAAAPTSVAPATGQGFKVDLRQTPAQKRTADLLKAAKGTKISEEGETEIPLNKTALNKIFMGIAQSGAMGRGAAQPQQAAAQQPTAQSKTQTTAQPTTSAKTKTTAPDQTDQSGTQATASELPSGPAIPLNKAALNKIFIGVAQAQAGS